MDHFYADMTCNMTPSDRLFRIVVGFIFLIVALNFSLWLLLPSIPFLLAGYTRHCFIFKLLGINENLEKENFYLSYLPRINPEPIFVFNAQGKISFQNKSSKEILPLVNEFYDFFPNEDYNIPEIIHQRKTMNLRYQEGGTCYMLECKGVKEIGAILVYGFDITIIVENEITFKNLFITDSLTTLSNRNKLIEDLDSTTAEHFALILLDIKDFGQLNNYYGFLQGDIYLKSFSEVFSMFVTNRENVITAYRLYSDVFAMSIMIEKKEDGFDFKKELYSIVDDLKVYLDKSQIMMGEIALHPSLTFGIASNSLCTSNAIPAEILNKADTALMEAKRNQRDILAYCDIKDIEKSYELNLLWSNKIRETLAGNNDIVLRPFYQPIKDLKTDKIEKYECLIRMLDQDQIISPAAFLPPVKNMGLLPDITEIVIKESFEYFSGTDMQFSINISKQDFIAKKFVQSLLNNSKKWGIKPENVIIELLEDDNIYEYIDLISQLKEYGFLIAIDDFGTGYSNFGMQRDLQVDFIKIDGSLIKNIATDSRSLSALKSIVDYTRSIKAKTIAEFVSNEEIYEIVKDLGIDYAQGFFIGKPEKLIIHDVEPTEQR